MTAEWVPKTAGETQEQDALKSCIFEESLTVQVALAETIVYGSEQDRQRTLAAISLTKKALELHKAQRDCSDLCKGGPVCPMRDWIMFSRAGAAAVWKPEDFGADLSLGSSVTDRTSLPASEQQKTAIGFTSASQQQGKIRGSD